MAGDGPDPLDYGARAAALRAERAEHIRELRRRGHSVRKVAELVGVSTATVQSDTAGTDERQSAEEFMRSKFGSTPSSEQHGDPVTAPSKRITDPPSDSRDASQWMREKRDDQLRGSGGPYGVDTV